MKKTLLFIILIAASSIANQVKAQVEVSIGVKGGVNLATIEFEDISSNTNYTGFHGGAFFLFKLSKIGIQPEVIFSKQGSGFTVDTKDLQANYDYINIPIMCKIYLLAGLNIQVGPQIGFLAGAEREFFDDVSNAVRKRDITNQIKGADIGIGLGLGWDLPFGLVVDARYNFGLTTLNDSAGSADEKNRVIQVSLGYKIFKIGGKK